MVKKNREAKGLIIHHEKIWFLPNNECTVKLLVESNQIFGVGGRAIMQAGFAGSLVGSRSLFGTLLDWCENVPSFLAWILCVRLNRAVGFPGIMAEWHFANFHLGFPFEKGVRGIEEAMIVI